MFRLCFPGIMVILRSVEVVSMAVGVMFVDI